MHATTEFALTRADYRLLSKAAARRLRRAPTNHLVSLALKFASWCLLFAGLFLYFRLRDRFLDEAGTLDLSAGLVAAGTLLGVLSTTFVHASLRGRMVRDDGAFLRRHALAFSDEAMRMTWSTGDARIEWSNVVGKAEDAANYYLFVDASAAYVVPRAQVAPFQADFDRWLARLPA